MRFGFIFLIMACASETKIAEDDGIGVVDNRDGDGDGFDVDDCDDTNPLINPSATEVCDGVDNDCDGLTDEDVEQVYFADTDGDGFGSENEELTACEQPSGYVPNANDCDDTNDQIFPGAPEECDGLDNDCNDVIDDQVGEIFYVDADGDGFGSDETVSLCEWEEGFAEQSGDCNDTNDRVYPSAQEYCDELDNDCNGTVDDGSSFVFYQDYDSDGYGNPLSQIEACAPPEGYVINNLDCNDLDTNVRPDATELCDELDNDCDGQTDEDIGDPYYVDSDGDGFGSSSFILSCTLPTGYSATSSDCDDTQSTVNPAADEICDGIDNNCDGNIDDSSAIDATQWFIDYDSDGYGSTSYTLIQCDQPVGYELNSSDCDDTKSTVNPAADEICDGIDNNCDGNIDDSSAVDATLWFVDYDSDGYGADSLQLIQCDQPAGYEANSDDCDDLDDSIYPGAALRCDGSDGDCDGVVDNDGDGDGFADYLCGGDDCNDQDVLLFPINGVCAGGTSCLDIFDAGLSIGDGVYAIDPDGAGTGDDPFDVYCDMENGGWTLAMRFSPSGSTLTFNSPYWTDMQTLDGNNLDPDDPSDGKFASYTLVEGDEIQGCFYGGCKSYFMDQTQSLYTLFVDTPIGSDSNGSGGYFFSESNSQRLQWLSFQGLSLSNASTSANYIRTGINIDDDMSCYDARVRFGLVLNNESTIYTLNDAAGFGASAYYSGSCDYSDSQDAPWSVGAGFAAGGNLYQRAGTIWVR